VAASAETLQFAQMLFYTSSHCQEKKEKASSGILVGDFIVGSHRIAVSLFWSTWSSLPSKKPEDPREKD
jgi:thiamine kinase-like enzyme